MRDEALAHDAAGIAGVSVRIERRGELQRLVLAVSDLFAKKTTSLSPGHDDVLDGLATLIKKYPSYPVQVVGHTDNKGKASELIALSAARSQAVLTALVSRGVEARRLCRTASAATAHRRQSQLATREEQPRRDRLPLSLRRTAG